MIIYLQEIVNGLVNLFGLVGSFQLTLKIIIMQLFS